MAREFYDDVMKAYFSGRSVYTNREVPLLDVVNQGYVYYMKGAVAMYTLRERLGADAVNGALRRFRDAYSGPNAPAPTSRALYAELRAAALLRRIEDGAVEHRTKIREIYNNQWSDLATREEVLEAVEHLQGLGWVRLVRVKPPGGGRPSEELHVHPDLREAS